MPIDLATVNWVYVGILSVMAFVSALLGSLVSFRNRFGGAVIAAILFAAAFVYWTYYPHPNIPGPISIGATTANGTASGSPAPASAPANPVSTLSQAPRNPVSTMSQTPSSPPPSDAK